MKVKLASALLQLRDAQGDLYIDWEHAKLMDADQIISLFQFDHYPLRHEAGGPDEPWNIVPTLILAHREKTATIDVPQIAKIKRIQKDAQAHWLRLQIKAGQAMAEDFPNTWGKVKPKWPSRPFRRK